MVSCEIALAESLNEMIEKKLFNDAMKLLISVKSTFSDYDKYMDMVYNARFEEICISRKECV
jgi:hypothetical protein